MKVVKKLTAVLLAGALLASVTACSGDVSWAMKNDNMTVPIGAYIYNLYAAYSSAKSKVADAGKPVLEQQIEEKDAATWIREEAMTATKRLLLLDDKMREMNLTLSEDEKKAAQSNTNSGWAQSQAKLEGYGIAKASYQMVSAEASTKYSKLFFALYGKGGKNEISQSDLKAYYEKNYADYEFFYAMYSKVDSTTGSSAAMSDDEKKALKEKMEGYAKEINDGKLTMEKAAEKYKTDSESEEDPLQKVTENLENSSYPEEMTKALKEMKNGEAKVVEAMGSFVVLLYKKDATAKTSSYISDETTVKNVIADIKFEEFNDAFTKEAEEYTNFQLNQAAIDGQKIEKFVEPVSSSAGSSSSASSSGSSSEAGSSSAASSNSSSSSESSK